MQDTLQNIQEILQNYIKKNHNMSSEEKACISLFEW